MTARELALEVLLEVERGGFADTLLGRALARSSLSAADKGLAAIIVYGTLAHQYMLDAHIDARSDGKLDAAVRVLLRTAFFQLLHLDRVPDYAVVDETVELAKKHAGKASGLVNAVLRRALREKLAPPGVADRDAFELSHPHWLAELFREELGHEAALELMRANNTANPTVLRALCDVDDALAELAKEGVTAERARYAPEAIVASTAGELPCVAVAQGEASQLVCRLADVQPGQRILDACAAPGGKTAYLALLTGEDGYLLAVDPAHNAEHSIRGTLQRTKPLSRRYPAFEIREASLLEIEPDPSFDVVLVDAPCSGLGTLRQHPEIRWRRDANDPFVLSALQARLLEHAANFVRPGGLLLYSTCTLSNTENDHVADRFVREDFTELSSAPEGFLSELIDERGRFRTFPHVHGTDGFFAARWRRHA